VEFTYLANICQCLDLHRTLLDLSVSHAQAELIAPRLDGVPSGQSTCEVDIALHAEIGRVDDFVGRWVS